MDSSRFDYAYLDPRSVHAQLHGYGDGREKRIERFLSRAQRRHPGASEDELLVLYRGHVAKPAHERLLDWVEDAPGGLRFVGVVRRSEGIGRLIAGPFYLAVAWLIFQHIVR